MSKARWIAKSPNGFGRPPKTMRYAWRSSEREPDRHHDERDVAGAPPAERPPQASFEREAEHATGCNREERREDERNAGSARGVGEEERHERPERHELTVREVDEARHPEDHREPDRGDREHETEPRPEHQQVQEAVEVRLPTFPRRPEGEDHALDLSLDDCDVVERRAIRIAQLGRSRQGVRVDRHLVGARPGNLDDPLAIFVGHPSADDALAAAHRELDTFERSSPLVAHESANGLGGLGRLGLLPGRVTVEHDHHGRHEDEQAGARDSGPSPWSHAAPLALRRVPHRFGAFPVYVPKRGTPVRIRSMPQTSEAPRPPLTTPDPSALDDRCGMMVR